MSVHMFKNPVDEFDRRSDYNGQHPKDRSDERNHDYFFGYFEKEGKNPRLFKPRMLGHSLERTAQNI